MTEGRPVQKAQDHGPFAPDAEAVHDGEQDRGGKDDDPRALGMQWGLTVDVEFFGAPAGPDPAEGENQERRGRGDGEKDPLGDDPRPEHARQVKGAEPKIVRVEPGKGRKEHEGQDEKPQHDQEALFEFEGRQLEVLPALFKDIFH
jgi:hypothetical protein